MAEALFPDEALVEVQQLGDTKVNVTVDIDNFEESGFEREIETRPFFGGAKVTIKKPQADGEITLNAKLTRALWDQMLWGGTGSEFTSGGDQNSYRITFLVSKEDGITEASSVLAAGSDHYRKTYANCFMTGFNPKLEAEGMLEGEATFMVSPVDENGDANILVQIGDSLGLGFDAHEEFIIGTKW